MANEERLAILSPPDKQEHATQTVLEQAELWGRSGRSDASTFRYTTRKTPHS